MNQTVIAEDVLAVLCCSGGLYRESSTGRVSDGGIEGKQRLNRAVWNSWPSNNMAALASWRIGCGVWSVGRQTEKKGNRAAKVCFPAPENGHCQLELPSCHNIRRYTARRPKMAIFGSMALAKKSQGAALIAQRLKPKLKASFPGIVSRRQAVSNTRLRGDCHAIWL